MQYFQMETGAATGAGDLAAARNIGEFDGILAVRATNVHGVDTICVSGICQRKKT
jgi:hypothetical protein